MGNLSNFRIILFLAIFIVNVLPRIAASAEAPATAVSITPSLCLDSGSAQTLSTEKSKCTESQVAASSSCDENQSSKIAEINQMMTMAAQSIGGMSGANQICGKLNDVLGLANIGLTAFSQVCSYKKMTCDRTCTAVQNKINNIINTCNSSLAEQQLFSANPIQYPMAALEVSKIQATITGLQGSAKEVAANEAVCQGYTSQLALAALSAATNLMALKQANNCEQATNAGLTPPKAVDCSKPENAQLQQCICEKNPRITGCSGLAGVGSGTTPSLNASGLDGLEGPNTNPNLDDLIDDDSGIAAVAKKPGDTGAPPAGGGGSGLLSGAGGAGQGQGGKGGPGKSGLDTNILGGVSGGGGGGGSRGGANSAMRAYMPGGKKDPTRALAGKLNIPISSQVTRDAGMSNFEKVKRTYNVTRGTLLPN